MKMLITSLFPVLLFAVAVSAEKPIREPGAKGPADMPEHMLKMMDTNEDGKISKDEWQKHHDQRFAEIDTDKDGVITPAEIKEHHTKMREKRAEMCPDCPRPMKGMRKGPRKTAMDDESE